MNLFTFLAQTATVTPSATATPTPTPVHDIMQAESFWHSWAGISLVIGAVLAVGMLIGAGLKKKDGSPSAASLFANFTNALAYMVVGLAFLGILILGYVVLSADHSSDTTKYVFAAILPLLGTWVGTVLAHYFQKESLVAANQSISDLAKTVGNAGKLASLPVKDFMIGPGKITTLPPDLQGKKDEQIPLKSISDHLKSVKLDRVPLFAENKEGGVAEKVVHLSKIEKYLADKALNPTAPAVADPAGGGVPAAPPNISALTLADLFREVLPPSTFKNFTFVKESATLADAKVAMDSMTSTPGVIGNCYDIFVTATGVCTEPVIGWITNDIVNENAKI
jgi:cytochrome b561